MVGDNRHRLGIWDADPSAFHVTDEKSCNTTSKGIVKAESISCLRTVHSSVLDGNVHMHTDFELH